MRDRTGRVAVRLRCGPPCIATLPLGESRPVPILCQTAWIGKSTGKMGIVLSGGSEFPEPAAPMSGKHLLTHDSKLADYGDFVIVV